jgi:geranylgeranyl pyrophosphate synthase
MAAADLIDEWTDDDPSDVVARYGPRQALNAGNLLLVMAQQQLARHAAGEGSDRALQALLALQGMLVEAATGQHLDMLHSGASVWQVPLETSARITALKAGALIAGAFQVGALMSGAPEEVVVRVTRIGRELGAIAQIENDIGDVLPQEMGGETATLRKTDIALRKPTMPIIFTLRAEEGEPNALQRAYAEPPGTPQEEEALRHAIVEAGGARFGSLLIEVHRQNALAALEELESLRPRAREALSTFFSS